MRFPMILKLLIVLAVFCSAGPAGAFEMPEEALKLLAEASTDPCSICAQADRKKAFALLEKTYAPGSVIRTVPECRLVKADPDANDLSPTCFPTEAFMSSLKEGGQPPRVVFTFHTPEKKLVGIAGKDFTDGEIALTLSRAKPGTVFQGRLEIVGYPYGDGSCFNYFKETGRLQVHCRVLELKAAGK